MPEEDTRSSRQGHSGLREKEGTGSAEKHTDAQTDTEETGTLQREGPRAGSLDPGRPGACAHIQAFLSPGPPCPGGGDTTSPRLPHTVLSLAVHSARALISREARERLTWTNSPPLLGVWNGWYLNAFVA